MRGVRDAWWPAAAASGATQFQAHQKCQQCLTAAFEHFIARDCVTATVRSKEREKGKQGEEARREASRFTQQLEKYRNFLATPLTESDLNVPYLSLDVDCD